MAPKVNPFDTCCRGCNQPCELTELEYGIGLCYYCLHDGEILMAELKKALQEDDYYRASKIFERGIQFYAPRH